MAAAHDSTTSEDDAPDTEEKWPRKDRQYPLSKPVGSSPQESHGASRLTDAGRSHRHHTHEPGQFLMNIVDYENNPTARDEMCGTLPAEGQEAAA